MKKSKVVIFGIGHFAEYVSYVLSNDSEHEISAFCIESNYNIEHSDNFHNIPIVDFENLELDFPPDEYRLFIAIGTNSLREKIFKLSKQKGYSFISYVSSKATFWEDLKYGENVFIGEDTGIHPFVSIGENTLILAAKIAHHSTIGNNVLLSNCVLAGNVTIGDNSFIGLNSMIKQNTIIGRKNIIGMGSIITRNTQDGEVYSEKPTSKRSISSERFETQYLL